MPKGKKTEVPGPAPSSGKLYQTRTAGAENIIYIIRRPALARPKVPDRSPNPPSPVPRTWSSSPRPPFHLPKAAKKPHSESLFAASSQHLRAARRCREQRFYEVHSSIVWLFARCSTGSFRLGSTPTAFVSTPAPLPHCACVDGLNDRNTPRGSVKYSSVSTGGWFSTRG